MTHREPRPVPALAALVLLAGCASLRPQQPAEAGVVVRDAEGRPMARRRHRRNLPTIAIAGHVTTMAVRAVYGPFRCAARATARAFTGRGVGTAAKRV